MVSRPITEEEKLRSLEDDSHFGIYPCLLDQLVSLGTFVDSQKPFSAALYFPFHDQRACVPPSPLPARCPCTWLTGPPPRRTSTEK